MNTYIKMLRAKGADMTDIKPCPFCGGDGKIDESLPHYPPLTYWVHCDQCGSESDVYPDKDGALEAWNRRADE